VSRGQLTLFQCAAKKQKQSINPTKDSESELEHQDRELDSDRSKSESESESDPDGSSDQIADSPCQENYINVNRPSGSTTIIVNAKSIQQSHQCVYSLSNICLQLTSPMGLCNLLLSQRFNFQCVPLGKADHVLLTVNGIKASVGLSIQFSKMQHIDTHADISS